MARQRRARGLLRAAECARGARELPVWRVRVGRRTWKRTGKRAASRLRGRVQHGHEGERRPYVPVPPQPAAGAASSVLEQLRTPHAQPVQLAHIPASCPHLVRGRSRGPVWAGSRGWGRVRVSGLGLGSALALTLAPQHLVRVRVKVSSARTDSWASRRRWLTRLLWL